MECGGVTPPWMAEASAGAGLARARCEPISLRPEASLGHPRRSTALHMRTIAEKRRETLGR